MAQCGAPEVCQIMPRYSQVQRFPLCPTTSIEKPPQNKGNRPKASKKQPQPTKGPQGITTTIHGLCLFLCHSLGILYGGGDLVREETCLEKFRTPNSGAIFPITFNDCGAIFPILFFGHQVQNLYPVLGGGV